VTGTEPWVGRAAEEESYFVSVSDLMVGMLFVFIIVLMAFALNFRSAQEEAARVQQTLAEARDQLVRERNALAAERDSLSRERDRLAKEQERLGREVTALVEQRNDLARMADALLERDDTRTRMLQSVQDLLRTRDVEVVVEPANGILRLPEALLFETGESVLRPEGERALRELATALAHSLPCYSMAPPVMQTDCPRGALNLLEAVLVEGHTDDRPISNPAVQDNWILSAMRGVNTFKALTRFEPSLDLLRNDRGEALLGVSSYEARRPVSTLPTAEARRLNRRIDLRFIVAAPSAPEIERMRERLKMIGQPTR
jgi:chemotaxis protein MotB